MLEDYETMLNEVDDAMSGDDVYDLPEEDRVSLDEYAREERFAQARRMPTDD